MPQPASAAGHRVALVTGVLDLGGTTTFLCNLGGELLRRGIPTAVFSFRQHHPLAKDFERQQIPVFATDERRFIYEDCLVRILGEIARFQPTVVVASLAATAFEVLRYVPAGTFRIGMAQSHDPGVYRTIGFYAGHVDAMAAVSKAIHQTIPTLPEFAKVPVHYLPYGVPIPAAPTAPASAPGTPLRILYLGRLEQSQKRVRCFPEILARLAASGIPFHWTIAGEGEEGPLLRSTMRSPSPTQTISFIGKVQYSDVPRVLAEHDLFLLASGFEGLPLSLLEAMASGLVPVVSDLASGIREVVDETSGLLVDPNHIPGYADAIAHLHHHRDELARLRRNVRDKVEREFSVGAMTDRWLRVLPAAPGTPPAWAAKWSVQPILMGADSWRFSPPMRLLRRYALRLKTVRQPY